MCRSLLACLVVVALTVAARGGGKKKDDDPLPRKEAILKRCAGEFVRLSPGMGKFPARFVMGGAKGPADERPAHEVTLTRPFEHGRYEVTQELYHVIMGNNPSKWKGPRNSVEMVTWDDANTFCKRLTDELRQRKFLAADEQIRLPSEAEWEYACRAGTTTAWSFGDDVKDIGTYAWYKVNAPGNDPPVGSKRPNPWGLHEMHGYVAEWCLDTWHPDYKGAPADGSAWTDGGATTEHIIRGGSFADEPDVQRCAARQHVPAKTRSDKLGFRVVKDKRGQ
jgi:formylglycine-generating enzyme required for sulfatase activity